MYSYLQWSTFQGRIQDFKLRGAHLNKIAPSGGRRENFWSISCEKSRFYAKKSYFFQLRRETRKFLGYFVWKITILRQKIIFFPIAEGGAKHFGVFRMKNHYFTPKNHNFSNCGGRRKTFLGISCEKSRFYAKKKIRPCVVCQKYNTDLDDFRNNEITGIIYQ
jgi:hypothetical protein